MIAKSDTESSNSDDDSNTDTESDTNSDHNNNEDMDQMATLLVKSFKKMVYKNFKKGRRFSIKDDGVNYSLMAKADAKADNAELKVAQFTLAFDTNDIYELRLFLKSLHVSYRYQTLENNRIKSENSELKKMNDHLEIELFSMLEIQKERDNILYVKEKLLEKHAYREKELAKDREVIKLWTNSEKSTREILENGCWGSGLGYSSKSNSDKKSEKETERTEPIKTIRKVKLNKVQIKTTKFNPSANIVKSIHEEGTTSAPRSNLITDKSEQVHTKPVNIGSMTRKQLKQKLKDLHIKKRGKGLGKIGMARRNALVLDSGCLGHMTGYKSLLSEFEEKASPRVSYGDENLGKILGYGKIKVGNVIIENIALVAGLKHNLISVSQICDRGYHVNFYEEHCEIVSKSDDKITLTGVRHGSLYEVRVSTSIDDSEVCLLSRASMEDSWNRHKRLYHLNFNNIDELVRKDLVRGLPNAVFTPDGLCDSCQKAKQRKTSFKSKTESFILEPYHLLHIDLFGLVNVMSISKKRYALVIVDEYIRYTLVYFLHNKDESPSILLDHVRELEKGSTYKVKIIRSDNGTKFKNSSMEEFCKLKGIKQEFSALGTP
ncbi:hypothetical protein AgCh_012825 [Apium graveolens]